MSLPQATRGAAESVQGPRAGKVLALSTSAGEINLSTWAGRYVRVRIEGCAAYYLMAAATGATIDATATSGATTCDYLPDGGSDDFLVNPDFPFLRTKAKSGTGYARVFAR